MGKIQALTLEDTNYFLYIECNTLIQKEGIYMSTELSYEEAKEIYFSIQNNLDLSDDDIVGLYNDMINRAVRYANIRAEWNSLTRDQKREKDDSRTFAHDAVIMAVNIVARTQGNEGAVWRSRLTDDRKRIGDFACYIALFKGLEAR